MSEAATSKRRGFFSSFQYVTLIGGQMMALLVLVILQNIMPKGDLTEWGWRIPFAIGGVAALVVLWLRRSMEETVSAEQVEAAKVPAVAGVAQPGTMKLLFTQYWKPLLICIGVTLGGTVAFYTYTNFILKFMNDTSGIAKTDTSVINFWALFIFMLLQPVYGIISDKVGRKPLLLWFGITGVLFTWPLLSTLAGTKDPFTAFLLMMGGLLIVGGYTSINALVKAELFPASIRALGVGLGYAIANSLFGGTVPLMGAAFQKAERVDLFFTYVTVAIAHLAAGLHLRAEEQEVHPPGPRTGPRLGARCRPGCAGRRPQGRRQGPRRRLAPLGPLAAESAARTTAGCRLRDFGPAAGGPPPSSFRDRLPVRRPEGAGQRQRTPWIGQPNDGRR